MSGESSGVSPEEQGPAPRTLQGSVRLGASLALRVLSSVSAFMPWRMVEAALYPYAQPPAANLGTGRSASARAEFRLFTREKVRAWCLQTVSFARVRCCRPVARSR